MSRPSKQPWTREQLTWYLREKYFDTTNWFGSDFTNKGARNNAALWEVENGRRELRREPYFWEIFRRHPQLGEIISVSTSTKQPNGLVSENIIEWVKAIVPPGSADSLVFLLKFAGRTWIDLGSDRQKVFTGLIDEFTCDSSGRCKGSLPTKNPVIDLDSILDLEVGESLRTILRPEVTFRELLEPYAVFLGGDLRLFVVRPRCTLTHIIDGAKSLLKNAVDLPTLGEKGGKEGWFNLRLPAIEAPLPPDSIVDLLRRANPKATLKLESDGSTLKASWRYRSCSAPKKEMRLKDVKLQILTKIDRGEPITNSVFVGANEIFDSMNLLRFFRESESVSMRGENE